LTKPIQGKVAAILTGHEIVLNIGSNDGVEKGMKFEIRSSPIPITDPDSGNKIGEVTVTRAKVSVYELHPKFSLAETYRVASTLPYPTLFRAPKIPELPVAKSDLLETQETVKVGDLVRQVV